MAREGPCYVPQRSSPFVSPTELNSWQRKRMKFSDDPWLNGLHDKLKYKRGKSLPDIADHSDPFSVPNLMEELDLGIYGSVTKDIEDLCARRFQMLQPAFSLYPALSNHHPDFSHQSPTSGKTINFTSGGIIDLDDDCVLICPDAVEDSKPACKSSAEEMLLGHGYKSIVSLNDCQIHNNSSVVILDSDDEESAEKIGMAQASTCNLETLSSEIPQVDANQKASWQYEEVILKRQIAENPSTDFAGTDIRESKVTREEQKTLNDEAEPEKDKGLYVGVQGNKLNHERSPQSDPDDGLGDIWREMSLALECSKDATGDTVENNVNEEKECGHSFVLKDDLGYVCRVCGVIRKSIDTIFDFQWGKVSKTTRTYMSEPRSTKEREECGASPFPGVNSSHDLAKFDISVHPRHMKQMKVHQLEGFNFLVRNLISDNPCGCILAHAPGSGKTFMLISFIQSFLAKYPQARPLVVLPKGILATWKKEFAIWQVEDLPLYDFYSSNALSREEQLMVLKEWVEHKGILFLGYSQFASIVSKSESSRSAVACHDILLQVPSILICDEGHTPRNEETDVLRSLAKVQTPRKVVLSGTLFQNHVKEVFNILNLVRPKFLKSDTSQIIKRRVMSRVQISSGRRQVKAGADALFFDTVEDTLQNDDNLRRKVTVIQDLREMTSNVLHYYKGDFLDELPGMVDFTVLLNLSPQQRRIIDSLKKVEQFKRTAIGSAVSLHPMLKEISEGPAVGDKGCRVNDEKLDKLLMKLDVRDGVKAKFFVNILGLCESSGEKLLVFCKYLLPMKFLERLVVRTKGWRVGKEIFMISSYVSQPK